MKVSIKGKKIVLSDVPNKDVAGAFLIMSTKASEAIITDAHKGQKQYDLPEGVSKEDIEALYLRVL